MPLLCPAAQGHISTSPMLGWTVVQPEQWEAVSSAHLSAQALQRLLRFARTTVRAWLDCGAA